MNTSNIISAPAAADLSGKEYHVVKLTATGVDIALFADTVGQLGTLLRAVPHQEDGVYLGKAVAVQLRHASLHYATIGASSAAVAAGAGLILDTANPGKLVPSETAPIARAFQAFTASSGCVVRVYFL